MSANLTFQEEICNPSYEFARFKLALPQFWHSSQIQLKTTDLQSNVHQTKFDDSLQSSFRKDSYDRHNQVKNYHTIFVQSDYIVQKNSPIIQKGKHQDEKQKQEPNKNQKINNKLINHRQPDYTSIGHLRRQTESSGTQQYISPEFLITQLKKIHPYDQQIEQNRRNNNQQNLNQSFTPQFNQDNNQLQFKRNKRIFSPINQTQQNEDENDYFSYQNLLKSQKKQQDLHDSQQAQFKSKNEINHSNENSNNPDQNQIKRDSRFFSNPQDMRQFLQHINQSQSPQRELRTGKNSVHRLDPINLSYKPMKRDSSTQTIHNDQMHNDYTSGSFNSSQNLMEKTTPKRKSVQRQSQNMESLKRNFEHDKSQRQIFQKKTPEKIKKLPNLQMNIEDAREKVGRCVSYTISFENHQNKKQIFDSPLKQKIAKTNNSRTNSSEGKELCQRFLHHHHISEVSEYDTKIKQNIQKQQLQNISKQNKNTPNQSPNTGQSSSNYSKIGTVKNSPAKSKKSNISPSKVQVASYRNLHQKKQTQKHSMLSNFISDLDN